MRPEDIEVLNRARSELVRCLKPAEAPFLAHLMSRNVLSDVDAELIRQIVATSPEAEAVRELLHIYTRKANSLKPLIEALENGCYSSCVEDLMQPAFSVAPPSPDTARRVVRSALMTGEVPSNPDVYVERKPLLEEIRRALVDLAGSEDGGWVIISGLAGIGKTVLAASILSDPLITGATFSNIYWVNIGPNGDEKLLSIMSLLFSRLDHLDRKLQFSNIDEAIRKLRDVCCTTSPKL